MEDFKLISEELLDEDYPNGFDLREFSEIRSFNQRIQYCNKFLKRIAAGSSRIAYQVDNDKVLKIAKNAKGISQNESEAEGFKQNFAICAHVFETDRNDLWLEMELATKISPKRFQQITGVDIKDCLEWISANSRRNWNLANEIAMKYSENEFWYDFHDFLGNYGLEHMADYGVISSYGEVLRDGHPTAVLVDFGLTQDVYDSHYSRKVGY